MCRILINVPYRLQHVLVECLIQPMETKYLFYVCFLELQDQQQRAMALEHERRRAEEEAARLEAERQAALLAKEELAQQAEQQKKSQEQLVGVQIL